MLDPTAQTSIPMDVDQQPSCSGTTESPTTIMKRPRAHSSSSPMSVSVRLPADCIRRLAAIAGRHSTILNTLGIRRLQVSDSAPVNVVVVDTALHATCSNDSRPGSDDTRVESGLGSSRASTDNHHATTSSLSSQADSALAMAQDQHLVRRAITTNFQTKIPPPAPNRWAQPQQAGPSRTAASSSVVANMQQMVNNQTAHSANEPSLLVGLLTSSGVDSSGATKLDTKMSANHMNPGTPSGAPPPKKRKKPAQKKSKQPPMQPPMAHPGYGGAPMMPPGGDPSAAFMSHPYYQRPPPHPGTTDHHLAAMHAQQRMPPTQYAYDQQQQQQVPPHTPDMKQQWPPQQPSSPWTSSTHSATPTDDRASSVCSGTSVLSPSTLNCHPPDDVASMLSPTTTQHVAESIDAVLSGRAGYGGPQMHYDARLAEEKFYKQQVMSQHHQEQQQRLMQQHRQQQQQMAQQQAHNYPQTPQQVHASPGYPTYGNGYPSGYPVPAQQYYEQQQYHQQQQHGYPTPASVPQQSTAEYDPYAKPVATPYTQGYPEQKAPLMRHDYPQQMSQ